jgi:hypothetical protein
MTYDTARTEPPHQIIVLAETFLSVKLPPSAAPPSRKNWERKRGARNGTRRPLSAAFRKSVRQSGACYSLVDADERGRRDDASVCLAFDLIAQWVFPGAYLVDE